MPDTDAPSRSDSTSVQASAPQERVNLPAVIPQPQPAREGESWVARVWRAMFGWKANTARADLETVLENGGHAESGFSPQERTMLQNILALRGRRVDDVMVPRADIISVQQDIALGDLIKVFEGAGHSRLVVHNETLDDPVGMVHIRDVIGYMVRHAAVGAAKTRRKKPFPAGLDLKSIDLAVPLSLTKIIRQILFVPPSMPALDLLAKMQATRIHLALVIDEYGGTDGIVSMEDVVEQIVGDIEDEHDDDEAPSIVRQADGSFLADARASLEDVVTTVGPDFEVGEDVADEVDTLGGYVMTRVGRLPSRGEVVPGPGEFEIEVLDADPRRLKKVRITRGRPERGARRRDRPRSEAAPPTQPEQPSSEKGST
jgi:CBS domain containing-hemolysin-like protein